MKFKLRGLILLLLMVLAAGVAQALRPTNAPSPQLTSIGLATLIPTRFGEWQQQQEGVSQVVNPQQQATLELLYTETLSRTYVNGHGDRIMLSIAYGIQQDKQSQVHRPEVCYPAQGFSVRSEGTDRVSLPQGEIPVRRLLATLGARHEPITYWIRVGDDLASGWLAQKIAVVRQGLQGVVADGLLFRVSNLDENVAQSYALQDGFIRALLAATADDRRHLLIGRLRADSVARTQ